MSLLAPLLLALSVFASIPILLHLIRRKRVRVLELPTYRFLKKVAEQQRVRFRFQDQFLMMLRILILLLVALAFAGPLGGERSTEVDGPMLKPRNLLVLDDTRSMGALSGTRDTAFDVARRFVLILLWETGVEWEVGLASDFLGQRSPEEYLARGYQETLDLFERRPTPEGSGALEAALAKAVALLDDQTALWTVTDAAASNWEGTVDSRIADGPRIELIQVQGPRNIDNWAVTELSLNNQPLLENEPALLTTRFEFFGEGAPPSESPTVRYGWRSASGAATSEQFRPTAASGPTDATGERPSSWAVQFTIPSEGRIASVSTALLLPEGGADALLADNRSTLIPRFLEGVRILVVAETESWSKTIRAALVGFDCEIASSLEAPTARAGSFSGYVFLLEKESPHPGWGALLQEKARSGSGVLHLHDTQPDAVRIQNWTDWWNGWESVPAFEPAVGPGERLLPGEDRWFIDSLDPTALDLDWAADAFGGVRMEGWDSELDLVTVFGTRTPLFQTRSFGKGVLGSWGVPVSPRLTPLLYSAGWVPLISQMVKRTLVDSAWANPGSEAADSSLESRLAPIAEADRMRLGEAGYRIHMLDRVEPRIADLHQVRRNWTALVLLLCLMLALVEIGVSNYV